MSRVLTEMAMLIEPYMSTFDMRDFHEVRVVALAATAYAVLSFLGGGADDAKSYEAI